MRVPFDGVPAVSGLRVFGKGNGKPPEKVCKAQIKRPHPLNRILKWDAAEGAVRYNVRYGIAPDKLYSAWQVQEPYVNISFINLGEVYYAAIDSINENGVTEGEILTLG